MKHFFHPMSRAVTTHWMLTELDVPHEQVVVDFHNGASDTPEFRAVNPMGKVPTLLDGDVVVTETAAICAYLADRFPERGLAPPSGSAERGRYYRYLFFPGTTLEPMFTFEQFDGVDCSPRSVGWGDRERCLAAIDAMTPAAGWVLGDAFSAADVVYGGMLDFAMRFGMLAAPTPKVEAYVARLRARPAYQRSHPQGDGAA